MKRRHERRALAAERHVFSPKIPHDRQPRLGRDDVRVADLQRERHRGARPMPHRLPVAADGAHEFPSAGLGGEEFVHRPGEMSPDRHVGRAESVDLVFPGHGQRQQLRAQLRRIWQRVRREQLHGWREAHEHGIHRVHTRAGEHAHVEFVFRPSLHRPLK